MSSTTVQHIVLYTDGSCSPSNPGPGGWAFLPIVDGNPGELVSDGEAHSTNNRMELTAAIEALRFCGEGAKVEIYSDSQYVVKGITEWVPGWQRRNWKRGKGKEVINVDLWQMLDRENQRVRPVWRWVKAHAGDEYNELVDQEARLVAGDFANADAYLETDLPGTDFSNEE